MNRITSILILMLCLAVNLQVQAQSKAQNPMIWADVPDMSMVRVGDTFYMASTTMHMAPGVPIMKSTDLVNWKLVSYAYNTLVDNDPMNLNDGKNAYGSGSWAPCLRYHNGVFYVSTFSATSGKTHFFTTRDPENEPWKEVSFSPALHDHSFFFDEDGKIYIIWGGGTLSMAELKDDFSGLKEGTERVIIENASAPAGSNIMLKAEGTQLFKHQGKYYIFNITWPHNSMRTVVVHRADQIGGPYEGKLLLQDKGVAQGSIIDMPDGRWFAYLFRDFGAVGRIPYLVPMTWDNGWPVLGVDGKVPDELDLPVSTGLMPGLVHSDEFNRAKDEAALPLVWQWNHNPDNALWSVTRRKGYLRLTTGRLDNDFLTARNTLTQRTMGPVCAGEIALEVAKMKEGDFAGLALLQQKYGQVGVKVENGKRYVVMVSSQSGEVREVARVALNQKRVFFKAECDFRDRADVARFFYSLDGNNWQTIGEPLKMVYTLPHFMGYRFGLFNYATKAVGGYADFDYFRINNSLSKY
ncbi:beta-xylosidase [Breznakibacter xylanolyticus]|uniref:Beta-xylosidase n=1 Tax=Breznakibacter xylanolyticus TaxID=990 RepID=A0A2W7Q678_9BACT|nr:glycoside hydrolase 43 family protein [Breznakibacter xylanolyticus]PZX17239.1 beta-xylosidase [Breznakibacter xylanolyticus]